MYNKFGDKMYLIYDNINNYSIKDYKFFYKILDSKDKLKINKLINIRDKKSTILSRILLLKILKEKYNLNLHKLSFTYNKFGKPFINNVYFNISHSYDYVCVVASNKEIGIDIEKIRKININICNFFSTENEKNYIINSKNQYKNLFKIFCLKEAYFKMLGSDLSKIKNIEFCINNNIQNPKDNLNIILKYSILNYIIAIIERKK